MEPGVRGSEERTRYVLGSRSPRRLELLRHIVRSAAIEVIPPRSAEEASFDGLVDWPAIEGRLTDIVRAKSADVLAQVESRPTNQPMTVITADTIIVVRDSNGRLAVRGQPPDDPTWRDVVRRWFREDYAGKTHQVATVFSVALSGEPAIYRTVRSSVTFCRDVDRWLEWYLDTGEPRGKAGGYALQGAGSIFIERVEGSLSNVVGLPLRELAEVLAHGGLL